MILIALLSIFAIASSQTMRQTACVKLESVFDSFCPIQIERSSIQSMQGPPGKLGPIGRSGQKGRQGNKGDKGSPGEPNYDRVEEMISQRIQEVSDAQAQKYSEISNLLTEANEKIRNLENKPAGSDYCPMKYDGKCFWVESPNTLVTFEKGRLICSAQGGHPANVYSEEHYYMLMGYMRVFSSQRGYTHPWLGMQRNVQTGIVSLTNGTQVPFLKWRPGNPYSSSHSYLYLLTRMDWKDKDQHLGSASASGGEMFGVICEK